MTQPTTSSESPQEHKLRHREEMLRLARIVDEEAKATRLAKGVPTEEPRPLQEEPVSDSGGAVAGSGDTIKSEEPKYPAIGKGRRRKLKEPAVAASTEEGGDGSGASAAGPGRDAAKKRPRLRLLGRARTKQRSRNTVKAMEEEEAGDDGEGEPDKSTMPERKMSYTHKEFMMANFPEPKWLIEDVLPAEGLVVFIGRPKRGKSTWLRHCAVCLGSGREFIGRKLKQAKVVYICLEEPAKSVRAKLRKIGIMEADVVWKFELLPLNSDEGRQAFRDILQEEKADLVVIDTLTRAYGGRIDWNAQGAVTDLLSPLQQLAFEYECVILGTDHMGKRSTISDPDPVDDLIGSTAKAGIADVILGLYQTTRGNTTRRALHGTGRVGHFGLELDYDPGTESYRLADTFEVQLQDDVEKLVLKAIQALGKDAIAKNVARAIDMSLPATIQRLKDLRHNDQILATKVLRNKRLRTLYSLVNSSGKARKVG